MFPIRWLARSLVPAALLLLLGAQPSLARSRLIYQMPGPCRDIALTYDVEFSPYTQALADTLDSAHVRSTWFFLGNQVAYYPKLVRQVAARHEIGNHTYTHPVMPNLSIEGMRWEIKSAEQAITRIAGRSPRPYFRPPYGEWDRTLLDVTDELGYPDVLLWSVDTSDWAGPSVQTIRERLVQGAAPGSIVLQHGTVRNTVEATRLAIRDLRDLGYQFVTLSELIGQERGLRDFGGEPYIIQDGDTWEQIALCHNVTGPRLRAFNQGVALAPGRTLVAPHRDELVLNLNGERLALAAYSRLHGGRAVAHVRLAEKFEATVTWNGHQVLINRGAVQIAITPGERIALVNNIPIDMGTDAFRTEDRILVPVRFLAESLGVAVTWQPDAWVVELVSN